MAQLPTQQRQRVGQERVDLVEYWQSLMTLDATVPDIDHARRWQLPENWRENISTLPVGTKYCGLYLGEEGEPIKKWGCIMSQAYLDSLNYPGHWTNHKKAMQRLIDRNVNGVETGKHFAYIIGFYIDGPNVTFRSCANYVVNSRLEMERQGQNAPNREMSADDRVKIEECIQFIIRYFKKFFHIEGGRRSPIEEIIF